MPILGRPTETTDKVPLLDFENYFVGKWDFEWLMPESPLGPAGSVLGHDHLFEDRRATFEAVTQGEGPAGKFEMREKIVYDKDNKTVAREVTDSRGFSYKQSGPVGGDLGGIYNIHFDGDAVRDQRQDRAAAQRHPDALATQLSSGEFHLGRRRSVHEPRKPLVAEDAVATSSDRS